MANAENVDIEVLQKCLNPSDILQYNSLRNFIISGKVLTSSQQKKYDGYLEKIKEYRAEQEESQASPFMLSTAKIVEFFNPIITTHQAFSKWTQNPTFPKIAGGGKKYGNVWNLKIIFDWYLTYFMGDAEMSKRMLAEKLKYQEARSLREKLEVDELQGKLINLDLLSKDLSFVFLHMKSALLLWEKRLPGLLDGKDQKLMYSIIHKETTDILRHFAQGTKTLCKRQK